ncbi:MAG: DUF3791 domain-containing protein [Dysgonamonadaceae bacterium]|jgi:hypothetical protein|nr:DUF3791 domain-containing protein [Dysgonamonadaceae bacterium]
MTKQQRDANLMIVVAVEQYAMKYGISTSEAFELFRQNEIHTLIRKHYNALHTQPLDESFYFADDVLKRRLNKI